MMCRYQIPKDYLALSITNQETFEIAFAVVTPPTYSMEVYIGATVENPPLISEWPTYIPSKYYLGKTSYMDAPPHDEGRDQLFHMDARHYNDSCPPDDIVPKNSDKPNSEVDSGMEDEETVHVQVEVDLNRAPKCLGRIQYCLKRALERKTSNGY